MSVNKDVRWLRSPTLKGSAKRFTEFCRIDIPLQTKVDPNFDIEIYNEIAKRITKNLQASSSSNISAKGDK